MDSLLDILIYLQLAAIAFFDMKNKIISNKSIALLALLVIVQKAFSADVDFADVLQAAGVSAAVFGTLFYMGRGLAGGGDLKLALVLGVWLGLVNTAAAIYTAFVSGGIVGGCCLLFGLKKRGDKLPFAPFLVFGAVSAHAAGQKIIEFWFGF